MEALAALSKPMVKSHVPVLMAFAHLKEELDSMHHQTVLAVGAAFVGLFIANYGVFLAKPLFMISCASGCAAWTYFLCTEESSHVLPATWAMVLSLGIALLSLRLWHFAYPGFLFFSGCLLGGLAVLATAALVGVSPKPVNLLGLSVLAALLSGLAFMRFHNFGWRTLTPVLGGLFTATSARYCCAALASKDAMWTGFTPDLMHGPNIVLQVQPVMFWTSWVIAAVVGWYLQLAPLVGLREDPKLPFRAWLPERLARRPPCADEPAEGGLRLSLLEKEDKPMSEVEHAGSETESQEKAVYGDKKDHRAEIALVVSIITVLAVNWFASKQSLLVMGHMVLSAAFLPLASAGMVSYASPGMLLPSLFGPQADRLPRRMTHAVFNCSALACVLLGLGCIYASKAEKELQPQPARMRIHGSLGIFAVLLLLLEASSGFVKLYKKLRNSGDGPAFHPKLGRLAYLSTACTMVLGYLFPGVFPTYATPFLAATTIISVFCTLFFLNEKHRNERWHKRLELTMQYKEELERLANDQAHFGYLEKRVSVVDRTFSLMAKSATMSSASTALPPRDAPTLEFSAAEAAISKQYRFAYLHQIFFAWVRELKRTRLEAAQVALQGQDRLMQFMVEAKTLREV